MRNSDRRCGIVFKKRSTRSGLLCVTLPVVTWLGCQAVSTTHAIVAQDGSNAPQSTSQIPPGIILPARLETTISVKDAQLGQLLEARIMQDVPLPDRGKIVFGSLVKGSIVTVKQEETESGVDVTLRLHQVIDRGVSLTTATNLRAIASFMEVRRAQLPWTGTDTGTPPGWADTVQIGGDIRYGDGGMVKNPHKQKVGKAVRGGVLVYVMANPQEGCEGPVRGDDHLQALWVFSADACGTYGLKGVDIDKSAARRGEITLHFEKREMKLETGTGLLLRVVPGE